MFATLSRLLKNDDGATAIEYGLIAALIAVAAVTVLGTVGTNLTAYTNRTSRANDAGAGRHRGHLDPAPGCGQSLTAMVTREWPQRLSRSPTLPSASGCAALSHCGANPAH